MEPPERVEVDPYVDNHVPVTEGDDQFAEAVGELPQDNGLTGQSGHGTPPGAGDGHNGPPPQGAAGVDAHYEQATGNGHVAATSGLSMGSMQGYAEASTTQSVQDQVYVFARSQPFSVSGAYVRMPPVCTLPGVWRQLPDPSEFYELTRMPYPRMGYSPAPAGRMMPVPMTAAARTTVTTTITSSFAVSAMPSGLVCTGYTGLRAPIPGAYVYRPGYGPLADHQYCISSTYEDPRGVGIYGYPGTGLVGVGAVGRV